jgi:hypothetical protein
MIRSKAQKLSILALCTLFSQTAMADETMPRTETTKDGYGYNFIDDPMSGGNFGPSGSTIVVRTGPVRQTLIRARTSFVSEMLKSVENL